MHRNDLSQSHTIVSLIVTLRVLVWYGPLALLVTQAESARRRIRDIMSTATGTTSLAAREVVFSFHVMVKSSAFVDIDRHR